MTPRKKKTDAPLPEEAVVETTIVTSDVEPELAPEPEPAPIVTEPAVFDHDFIPEPEPEPEVSVLELDRAVAFHLAGQRYAMPIERVQEIQQIVEFSEVPQSGGAVVGMVNLRGAVIPAVDLRRLLGLPDQEYDLETPMIICRVRGHILAVVVDGVEDVLILPPGCVQAAPPMHQFSDRMLGVAMLEDGLLYLLDLEKVFSGLMSGGY